MLTFIYRCPNTGYLVQGASSEEMSDDGQRHVAVTCELCRRLHLVNPTTRETLGTNNG